MKTDKDLLRELDIKEASYADTGAELEVTVTFVDGSVVIFEGEENLKRIQQKIMEQQSRF